MPFSLLHVFFISFGFLMIYLVKEGLDYSRLEMKLHCIIPVYLRYTVDNTCLTQIYSQGFSQDLKILVYKQ